MKTVKKKQIFSWVWSKIFRGFLKQTMNLKEIERRQLQDEYSSKLKACVKTIARWRWRWWNFGLKKNWSLKEKDDETVLVFVGLCNSTIRVYENGTLKGGFLIYERWNNHLLRANTKSQHIRTYTSGKNLICCGFLAIICYDFGPKH